MLGTGDIMVNKTDMASAFTVIIAKILLCFMYQFHEKWRHRKNSAGHREMEASVAPDEVDGKGTSEEGGYEN